MKLSVDIDTSSKKKLVIVLWRGLRLGLELVYVNISSSGKGYHAVFEGDQIKTDIDNLMFRALLDDDPYRLRYSLKRLSMKRKVDILFSDKNFKRSTRMNLSDDTLEKIKNAKTLEEVIDLAEKLDIPEIKSSWQTIFEIPEILFEKIRDVLSDIRAKDASFRFRIVPNMYKSGKTKWLGVVYSQDKDIAHKRGTWLRYKIEGITGYWVKEYKRKVTA